MTQDVTRALAALGVAGQAIAVALLVAGLGAAAGFRAPLESLRRLVWGYELWLAFAVTATATGGSLFFSEIAHFVPCELCWFQRICMYPLAIMTLLAALANDHRVARYLLPLPLIGGGISIYHLLVESGVVTETQACRVSAPGGCATKWIDEFGYVTIPVLALTGFALTFAFLALAAAGAAPEAEPADTRVDVAQDPAWTRKRGAILAGIALLTAGGGIGWAIGHYAGRTDGTGTTTTSSGDLQRAAGRRVFVSAGCGGCQ